MLLAAAAALLAWPVSGLPAAGSAAAECAADSYRQLDFWLGDWDVYDLGGTTAVARAHITPILDGCVVHERYESQHTVGESFSIYDRTRGLWHQTWVTSRGRLLQVEGRLKDGRLELAGSYLNEQGERTGIRAAWWAASGGVRERAEISADAGRTWKPEFDLIFRPHRE